MATTDDSPDRAGALDLARLTQTTFDSATPAGGAVLAHPFRDAGDFVVSRLDGRTLVRSHSVTVRSADDEPIEGRPAPPALQFADAEVRLPAVDRTLDATELDQLHVQAGGYASFTGAARNLHTARLQRVTASGRTSTVWDSTKLDDGDYYGLTIAMPGRYRMRNTVDDAEATVTVTYPKVGRQPYQPAAPVTVRCTANQLDPDDLTLGPLQGLVVQIGAPARIVIELVEADNGPEPARRPSATAAARARAQEGKRDRHTAASYQRPD